MNKTEEMLEIALRMVEKVEAVQIEGNFATFIYFTNGDYANDAHKLATLVVEQENESLPSDATEAEKLLTEWAKWWEDTDDVPVKMPNSLHIRTLVYLQQRKYDSRKS
jgi:hypothetical protein